jgi:hypothetical protein
MGEVTGAYQVQALDLSIVSQLFYTHVLARRATVSSMHMQISDNPHLFSPICTLFGPSLAFSEEEQSVFFANVFEANFQQPLHFFRCLCYSPMKFFRSIAVDDE